MKKHLLLFFCFAFAFTVLQAQKSGQRVGGHAGYGFNSYYIEGSYQYDLSRGMRIEANAGFGYFYSRHEYMTMHNGSFSLGGSFQWTGTLTNEFWWYGGPCLMSFLGPKIDLAIGGVGGMEYRFPFPLRIGLEFRPLISANPLCEKYFDMPIFFTAKWDL